MERREFLINSYTGSGVAWILNFLIELDILVYRNNSISKTWEHGNNHYKLKKQEDVLKQWCPVLSEKNEFEFRENVSVRWAHEFPSNNNIKPKVILLVRDGRDTIYSQFKREKKFLDFDQMLSTPVEPFNLLPADTWALMNLWWTNSVKTENLHIIRFEDFKSNPLPYMKDLLNFLHISRSENDILRAIESSSFDRAKKAEENYRKLSANTQFEQVNRKGQPGEWKKIYNNEKLMFFEGLPNLALGRFGYKEDGTSTKALENLFDPTSAATDKDILALTALKQVYKNFQQEKDDKYATKSHIFLSKAIDLIKKHGGLEDLVEKEIDNDVYTTVCPLCNSSNIVFIGKINQEKKFATTKINLIKVPELWRCRKCESSFIQNITRETEAEKMYSLNNGIRWPSCKIINSKPKNIIQKISSLIHPGAKILDIGCGAGDLLDFAKDLGAKTYGVEISDNKTDLQKRGHIIFSSIQLIQSDIAFDLIFAFDLIEHLYNVPTFLDQCREKLSKHGKLVILTGNPNCLSAKLAKSRWWYISYPEHMVFPSKKYFRSLDGFSLLEYKPVFNSLRHREKFLFYPISPLAKMRQMVRQLIKLRYSGLPSLDRDHALIILSPNIHE